MKKYLLNAPLQSEEYTIYSLFAELILDKVLIDFQKRQLLIEIDKSLVNKDKKEFMKLTDKLKSLS